MAAAITPHPFTLDEYLRTSYHPDCDFVDDHLEERNVGDFDHGYLQTAIGSWFFTRRDEWNVYSVTEQRILVAPDRVRICDICLISREHRPEKVTQTPPLACIEILSPEDRLPRAAKVMDDYAHMGVQNLWLLDPLDDIAYIYTSNGQLRLVADRLSIPNTPIYLDLPALFASVQPRSTR